MPFAVQFALSSVQPFDHALRGRLGIGGVEALFLTRALLLAQPRRTRIPIIDLARQTGADLAFDLVDLGKPSPLHLGEMVRNQASDGIGESAIFNRLRQPGCCDHAFDGRTLLGRDWP